MPSCAMSIASTVMSNPIPLDICPARGFKGREQAESCRLPWISTHTNATVRKRNRRENGRRGASRGADRRNGAALCEAREAEKHQARSTCPFAKAYRAGGNCYDCDDADNGVIALFFLSAISLVHQAATWIMHDVKRSVFTRFAR